MNFRKMIPVAAAAAVLSLSSPAQADVAWKSGARGPDLPAFATWRGTPAQVAVGWAPWNSWSNLTSYFSGTQPNSLKSKSSNVSIGVGLFPTGSNQAACASGSYDSYYRSIGSALLSRVPDAELRLGWEPLSTDRPWHAVNRNAAQWRQCFVRAAKAIKAVAPNVRIAWHMNKKGSKNPGASNLWDSAVSSVVTNIGVSHYDDDQARFGTETSNGEPWGLRAWLSFAQSRGKKLEMAEWGVGRSGDRPSYIQSMHDFFHFAGDGLAHEGYFNSGNKTLYPSTNLPKSAALYRQLF